jgi:nitrogen fixation/metabolism regulation signal transduction histidine kinase
VFRAVAAGDLSSRVEVVSHDEIGELAQAFNQMTQHLVEQRDRAIQAERVAAWRELARRLAHELKNPLFPLQITIENLQRARERSAAEFDEVFREGTTTLLAELSNLKTIVGPWRFPMPARSLSVSLNEMVRVMSYMTQDCMPRRAPIPAAQTADGSAVAADTDQLRKRWAIWFLMHGRHARRWHTAGRDGEIEDGYEFR